MGPLSYLWLMTSKRSSAPVLERHFRALNPRLIEIFSLRHFHKRPLSWSNFAEIPSVLAARMILMRQKP